MTNQRDDQWVTLAQVVLKIPVFQAFEYLVPQELADRLKPGHIVRVPLSGRARAQGFVTGVRSQPRDQEELRQGLREIISLVDDHPLEQSLMSLSAWMAQRYLTPQGMVLDAITPAPVKRAVTRRAIAESVRRLATLDELGELAGSIPASQKARLRILNLLMESPEMALDQFLKQAQVPRNGLAWFQQKGLLEINQEKISRYRPPDSRDGEGSIPEPTPAQSRAIAEITGALNRGDCQVFLLHGITGSGKTEVYLRSIGATLQSGRSALVMVPEIALTPQIIRRFRDRFGDTVAVLHSNLSDGQRMDEWDRLRTGEARIAIGARSAVFAPLPDLGLIIVDEEHENSYKQARTPSYNAKEVALQRAREQGGVLVLGSATPSIEDYHLAGHGSYRLLELPERVGQGQLPPVTVVDMRLEFQQGNYSLFSRELKAAVEGALKSGGKVILLLNRRGHSSYVFCRNCGEPLRCDHCAVTMKYHLNNCLLKCHYCDFERSAPRECPNCGSPYIKYFGAGTQKVVSEAEKLFPGAGVLRMDADTTTTREAHDRILTAFEKGDRNILVGTQMVAKGLDIHSVTLVGIMSGDLALNLPDFRAGERTFQLVTQVAGRAGRGSQLGRVVLQTYQPENPVLQAAARQDFKAFYEMELPQREHHFFPPFSSLVRILFSHREEDKVSELAYRMFRELTLEMERQWGAQPGQGEIPRVRFIGPEEAPLARIREKYRWHLIMAVDQLERFMDLLRDVIAQHRDFGDGSRVSIDVEPQNLL